MKLLGCFRYTYISVNINERCFIETTDHRPADYRATETPTTYHLPTDPPTTYPPTYVKIEDQILNMLRNL